MYKKDLLLSTLVFMYNSHEKLKTNVDKLTSINELKNSSSSVGLQLVLTAIIPALSTKNDHCAIQSLSSSSSSLQILLLVSSSASIKKLIYIPVDHSCGCRYSQQDSQSKHFPAFLCISKIK